MDRQYSAGLSQLYFPNPILGLITTSGMASNSSSAVYLFPSRISRLVSRRPVRLLIPTPHPTLCPIPACPPPPPPPPLCILDHFLSFQVSGPVAADDPSPGGTGATHRLGGVPVTLRSRYAHSPHPVRVGGRGRGSGRPQAYRGGDLLQQQALMTNLFIFIFFSPFVYGFVFFTRIKLRHDRHTRPNT